MITSQMSEAEERREIKTAIDAIENCLEAKAQGKQQVATPWTTNGARSSASRQDGPVPRGEGSIAYRPTVPERTNSQGAVPPSRARNLHSRQ